MNPTTHFLGVCRKMSVLIRAMTSVGAIAAMSPTPMVAATTQVVAAFDTGWYEQQEGQFVLHLPENRNFVAGDANTPREWRSFFVFDLSAVHAPIQSAAFKAFVQPDGIGVSGQGQVETWTLFDVTTSIDDLLLGTSPNQTFQDLGSGAVLGSLNFSAAQRGTTVTVQLNSLAIDQLNAAGGRWAMGGAVTTRGPEAECIFHGSGEHSLARLEIVVSEPAGLSLVTVACAAVTFCRTRAQRVPSGTMVAARLGNNSIGPAALLVSS